MICASRPRRRPTRRVALQCPPSLAERDGRPEAGCAPDSTPCCASRRSQRLLGDGKAEALFVKGYRAVHHAAERQPSLPEPVHSLADSKNLPAVFHCASGKDRTGWAAAALLTLLGVEKETVMADYMRTNEYALPQSARMIEGFVTAGGDRAIAEAILGSSQSIWRLPSTRCESATGRLRVLRQGARASTPPDSGRLRDRFLSGK